MVNKKKRRPRDRYQLPGKVAQAQLSAAERAEWKPRPLVPRRRVVLGIFGMFLVLAGAALAFWLPPRALVNDLRDRGLTVAATVTGVDNKPKYVKVEFLQGPKAGTEVELWDYAGMYPEVHTGDAMLVTYDPNDLHRSLPHRWVADPPANLPAYGSSALALFFLSGTIAVALRRRWILKNWPPETPVEKPSEGVGLAKS
ncbi:hypothetical protein [Streptomyces sp. NPDC003717]|uniref:hypothetical protein n=1 Tax=Streptomyces sp. NPDC003717 TaxID=3154276 RepID=UPI0033A0C398